LITYLDSSSILSVYLREPDRHAIALHAVQAADFAACSVIALVEVQSGLTRARYKENPPRLNETRYSQTLSQFAQDWKSYYKIRVPQRILRSAVALVSKYRLRAYDAIHLASAIALWTSVGDDLHVATWDKELADAAQAEGLSLAHEVN
jgi:predicted nucleic acid-binding protein